MGAIFGWPPSLSWGRFGAPIRSTTRGVVVADGRRETNDGNARGRSGSGRPAPRSSEGRPSRGRPSSDRSSGRSSGRTDRPGRPDRAGGDGGRSSSSARPARKGDWSRPAAEQGDRTEQQERYDG